MLITEYIAHFNHYGVSYMPADSKQFIIKWRRDPLLLNYFQNTFMHKLNSFFLMLRSGVFETGHVLQRLPSRKMNDWRTAEAFADCTGWFYKVSLPGKYGRKALTHPERDGHDLNGKRIQKKEGAYVCIYFVHFAVCRN